MSTEGPRSSAKSLLRGAATEPRTHSSAEQAVARTARVPIGAHGKPSGNRMYSRTQCEFTSTGYRWHFWDDAISTGRLK
ncbi:hypothetical protein ACIQ6K_08495 [Streptomyces sp. NPDC096354]|uniref:hypothetical protein n=1 Tax=Streptomyces sp. NPDC096354 TaxID=3366088 RepID=UPI0037F310E2